MTTAYKREIYRQVIRRRGAARDYGILRNTQVIYKCARDKPGVMFLSRTSNIIEDSHHLINNVKPFSQQTYYPHQSTQQARK